MGILSGAALIFFAYTGFARVTIMAEEVKDPEKTIPRSIFLALGISTVIYLFVSIVAVGLAGAPVLAHSGSPLADAIGMTGSSGVVLVISLGAMIATASVLLTTIMGISRIVFSMARSQDLPTGIWQDSSPVQYAPLRDCDHRCLYDRSPPSCGFALVVAVSTFAMLLYYLIANIAAFRSAPGDTASILHGSPVIGALSCVGLIVFLSPDSWIVGFIGLLIGGAWFVFRRKNHS